MLVITGARRRGPCGLFPVLTLCLSGSNVGSGSQWVTGPGTHTMVLVRVCGVDKYKTRSHMLACAAGWPHGCGENFTGAVASGARGRPCQASARSAASKHEDLAVPAPLPPVSGANSPSGQLQPGSSREANSGTPSCGPGSGRGAGPSRWTQHMLRVFTVLSAQARGRASCRIRASFPASVNGRRLAPSVLTTGVQSQARSVWSWRRRPSSAGSSGL